MDINLNFLNDLNFSQEKIEEIKNLPQIKLSSRSKDMSGIKHDKILFLKPAEKDNRKTYWWTICECGTIEKTRVDSPKKACWHCSHKESGIKTSEKIKEDLTNLKFGKLTVLFPAKTRIRDLSTWHCKCECGKELDVIAASLKNGNTKSCGCLKKENSNFAKNKTNLIGKIFGDLTVLEETDKRQYGKIVWKCQCKCGNIIYLNTTRLTQGNDISCGCRKQSLGVQNIENILINNNIQYKKEYTESSLNLKKFDFAILDNSKVIRLIEFDGEQHFKSSGGWNTQEQVKATQQRDQIKNQWAKEYEIPLVRIPYWERDNITLDMIMGDKYLIK